MLFAVEVLRPELGEDRHEGGMGGDAGERVLLEALAGVQQSRGNASRSGGGTSRRKSGLRLFREVEPVRRVADRILPFGRILGTRKHLSHSDERLLPIGS